MNAYSARDELSVFWGDVHGKWVQRSVGFTDGRGVWGRMDTCIRMAKYLCRPPETITTLLTGFTPSQNNQFKSIYITTKKKGVKRPGSSHHKGRRIFFSISLILYQYERMDVHSTYWNHLIMYRLNHYTVYLQLITVLHVNCISKTGRRK